MIVKNLLIDLLVVMRRSVAPWLLGIETELAVR